MLDSETKLSLPPNISLPMFVYGALKPGMPAFESLREYVDGEPKKNKVAGELFVGDGLPLLFLNNSENVEGALLSWKSDQEENAYQLVCDFEPDKFYEWKEVKTTSGVYVNLLGAKHQTKGNPQPLFSQNWKLTNDPAFGEGLPVVRKSLEDLKSNVSWTEWERFFRAQMAYLLLWSIIERLSALCFGATKEPHHRVNRLHELPGMADLIIKNIQRSDKVSDSRNPNNGYSLNAAKPKKCFQYYYQVRCNLSHRGKAVQNEVEKVQSSLEELLNITEQYLMLLKEQEAHS